MQEGAELQLENFRLVDVVQEKIELYSTLAQEKQISLQTEFESCRPIRSDKNIVDLIVRNLLNNAIKFTPSGGTITIKIHKLSNGVEFVIQDSGIGIPKEHIDSIFSLENNKSKIQQGTKGEKGTGLGLVLSKQSLDKINGTIKVESELNVGTTFTIYLPFK